MQIGFFGLLTIVLVILKLTHVISWSWLLVFAPLAVGFAIGVVIAILAIIAAIVVG